MPKRLLPVIAAILATALIAAGCGGDDDETTSSTTSTTTGASGATGATGAASDGKAALISQADAICAAGDKEIDAEAKETFGGSNSEPSAEEQADFVENTVVPNIQNQLDQLSELEPPADVEGEFTGIIDDAQSALDELSDDPSAITQGSDPFTDVNKRAQAFGLSSCGGD